MTTFELTVLG